MLGLKLLLPPYLWQSGEGKGMVNSPLVTQVASQFPTYDPEIVMDVEFLPHCLLCWEFFFHHTYWTIGNWDVPFVTHVEFIIPNTCGFPSFGRNYPVPFYSPEGITPMLSNHWKILFVVFLRNFHFTDRNEHSYLESEKSAHFPPKELSNDFTGLVFSYLQSLYFRFNPYIFSFNSLTLDSILVFSDPIPLLYIQSLYFLIQFPYFRFNPSISGSILVFHSLSFHIKIGMPVLSFGNFRTGKIPYSSVNVHLNFLTHREFLIPSLVALSLVKELSRPQIAKW